MKNSLYLLILISLFLSCEREIELESVPNNSFVIDAFVTSDLKEHEVKLLETVDGAVENANANIINLNSMDTSWFSHQGEGFYKSPQIAILPSTDYEFNCFYKEDRYSYSTQSAPQFSIDTVNFSIPFPSIPNRKNMELSLSSLGSPLLDSDYHLYVKVFLGEEVTNNSGILDTIWHQDISEITISREISDFHFTAYSKTISGNLRHFGSYSSSMSFKLDSGTILKIEAFLVDEKTSDYLTGVLNDYTQSFDDPFLVATPNHPEFIFKSPEALGIAMIAMKQEKIITVP